MAEVKEGKVYCVESCEFNRDGFTKNEEMVECSMCGNWYHRKCIAKKKTETTGFWPCDDCIDGLKMGAVSKARKGAEASTREEGAKMGLEQEMDKLKARMGEMEERIQERQVSVCSELEKGIQELVERVEKMEFKCDKIKNDIIEEGKGEQEQKIQDLKTNISEALRKVQDKQERDLSDLNQRISQIIDRQGRIERENEELKKMNSELMRKLETGTTGISRRQEEIRMEGGGDERNGSNSERNMVTRNAEDTVGSRIEEQTTSMSFSQAVRSKRDRRTVERTLGSTSELNKSRLELQNRYAVLDNPSSVAESETANQMVGPYSKDNEKQEAETRKSEMLSRTENGTSVVTKITFLKKEEADRLKQNLMEQCGDRLERITGTQRESAYYGPVGYSYGVRDKITHSSYEEWPEVLLQLKKKVEETVGVKFNAALINKYTDENDQIGWHADDEPGVGSTIASVSLGGARRFQLKRKRGHRGLLEPTS